MPRTSSTDTPGSPPPPPIVTERGIDTLAISDYFQANGYTRQQAEAQAKVTFEIAQNHLASKDDIDELQADVSRDIRTVREDIKQLRHDMNREIHRLCEEQEKARHDTAQQFESSNTRFDEKLDHLHDTIRKEMKLQEQRLLIRLGSLMTAGIGFLVVLDRLL